jgi:hypothetical protein
MRTTIHAQTSQKSGSKAFIEKKLSKARYAGANRIAAAARNCAKRPPPNSRARIPVRNTTAAPASTGSKRMETSELPSKWRESHATKAMSGG